MTIYLVLILLITIYALLPYTRHNSKQSKKIFLLLSFTTMSLIIGLRGRTVGEDTDHYLNIFKYAPSVSWSDMLHSTGFRTGYYTDQYGFTDTIENGFLAFAKVLQIFTDNGQIFLIVIATMTCFLFAKFIYDNCEKVIFPTYIFLFESMFMLAFNGVRQILAVAITIQAYTLLKEKKWKQALLVIIIACLIHNVALVALILFPIMLIKPEKEYKKFKYFIVIAIFSPFIILAFQQIISITFPRYASYFLTNYWSNSIGGIAIVLLIEFAIIIYMYIHKFKVENSFPSACLVLLCLSCELMGLRITMFERVGWFFRPYLIIFFPFAKSYFNKKNWKIIQWGILLLLFMLYISYARTPAREYYFFWQ